MPIAPGAQPLHIEPLHLGLATARPAFLMEPGELQRALDSTYLPGSLSLHAAPVPVEQVTGLGSSVLGLVYAPFDYVIVTADMTASQVTINSVGPRDFSGVSVGATIYGEGIPDNTTVSAVVNVTTIEMSTAADDTRQGEIRFDADRYLVAQAGTNYWKSIVGSTAAVTIDDVSAGTHLSRVAYDEKCILLNGVNPNRVFLPNGTTRPHGLAPVLVGPGLEHTASGGSWTNPTGYYSFWTTEYDKLNDVESTYAGDKPPFINVTAATSQVTVSIPAKINPTATHYRVYRSVIMTAESDAQAAREDVFPAGFRIAEGEFTDDGTQAQVVVGATSSTSSNTNPSNVYQNQDIGGITWVNPTEALGAQDNVTASVTFPTAPNGVRRAVKLIVDTFGLTGITTPITGITVTVRAARVNSGRLAITLRSRRDPSVLAVKGLPTLTTSLASYTVGSTTDAWLPSGKYWTPEDFDDANFQLELDAYGDTASSQVHVDAVTVSVTHGTPDDEAIEPFPATIVSVLGEEVAVGRNGQPPKASIGVMFQNSLLIDDVDNRKLVRYSAVDYVDYFPEVYFLPLDHDFVNVQKANEVAVVFGYNQATRIAYLPRDVDSEFNRGRATITLSSDTGCVGKKAATVFSLADGAQKIAFCGASQPYMTDGYRIDPINPHVKYTDEVDFSYPELIEFVNNPARRELRMYYVPKGSVTPTVATRYLSFHYDKTHILRDGSLKCCGPVVASHRSVTAAETADGISQLYGGDGTTGTIYKENDGASANASVRTRRMPLVGLAHEWTLDDIYVYYSLYDFDATPDNITCTMRIFDPGTATATATAKTVARLTYPSDGNPSPRDERDVQLPYNNERGEAIDLLIAFGIAGVRNSLDMLGIFHRDGGRAHR